MEKISSESFEQPREKRHDHSRSRHHTHKTDIKSSRRHRSRKRSRSNSRHSNERRSSAFDATSQPKRRDDNAPFYVSDRKEKELTRAFVLVKQSEIEKVTEPQVPMQRVNKLITANGQQLKDVFSRGVKPDVASTRDFPFPCSKCNDSAMSFLTSTQLSDHLERAHGVRIHASLLKPSVKKVTGIANGATSDPESD